MGKDLLYALRIMRRAPAFTAAVVFTIALAIAANATIFSVVNAVLLRPLPFEHPDRLVQIAEKNDKLQLPSFGASVLNFLSWREQTHAFSQIAALGFSNDTLTSNGDPEQISGNLISPALTRVLGVRPILGRDFRDDEERPSAASVVMLGEGLWKRRFASDPSIVGRTIALNGQPTTVVGVAPASLNLLSGGDLYTPLRIDPAKEIRLNHVIIVFGRLAPGVSLPAAQAEMDTIAARVGRQYPEVRDWGIHLITLFDTFVSPQLKTALVLLFCAVGCVLLIACANVANLLLARAAARQREMAARTALGASRVRLVRQLLIESVVLAAGGGAAGLLLAFRAVSAINHALPPNTLPVPAVHLDAAVLWFTAGIAVLTGLLFGMAPAWRLARVDVAGMLKQGGRGASEPGRGALRNAFATTEIVLATILLIGAGLLLHSLANLRSVQLGFDPHGLLTFQIAPPVAKYPVTSTGPQFFRSLMASLNATPGVRSAAASSGVPFGNGNYTRHPMFTTGQSALPAGALVPIDWRIVSPGYFRTMSIPLLRGRNFTDADDATAQKVMIVSQSTAKKFWGDADPVGRTLTRSADPKTPFTVVGVVGDVRNAALDQEAPPSLYYPMAERSTAVMDIVVRTDGDPEALLPSMRQRVRQLDSELALANVRTMDQWLANSSAQPRLNTVLLTVFGLIALVIASIGIYGVLAYSVTLRTREIGVRMALGSTRRGVISLVIGEGMRVVLIGITLGLLGAFAGGRAIASLVYGITVHDPVTFILVASILAAVALIACAIPALRASRVDPMVALRYE